jgi:hypothetical protein
MQLAADQLLSDLRLHNISADTLKKVILQIPISMALIFFVDENEAIRLVELQKICVGLSQVVKLLLYMKYLLKTSLMYCYMI